MPLTLDPRRLDAFLTAPTPALGDDAERQQARLLARLLLLAGGLVLGLSLALPAFRPLPQTTYLTYFKRQPGGLVGLALGVGLLGAYWLSRTTHWQRAANLAGLLFQAGIAAGILASAEPDSAASLLVTSHPHPAVQPVPERPVDGRRHIAQYAGRRCAALPARLPFRGSRRRRAGGLHRLGADPGRPPAPRPAGSHPPGASGRHQPRAGRLQPQGPAGRPTGPRGQPAQERIPG